MCACVCIFMANSMVDLQYLYILWCNIIYSNNPPQSLYILENRNTMLSPGDFDICTSCMHCIYLRKICTRHCRCRLHDGQGYVSFIHLCACVHRRLCWKIPSFPLNRNTYIHWSKIDFNFRLPIDVRSVPFWVYCVIIEIIIENVSRKNLQRLFETY